MTFDMGIWKRSVGFIASDNLPEWPCPTCLEGVVKLDRNSLKIKELARQLNNEVFESEHFEENTLLGLLSIFAKVAVQYNEMKCWTQARFTGFLKCTNGNCQELVTFTGLAKIPIKNAQGSYSMATCETLQPEYFSPPLPILRLDSACPEKLRRELIRSFSLFFNDTASASNRLRTAVELLLEDQNIPNVFIGEDGQPEKNKHGKTIYRSLHTRIEELMKRNHDLGKMLLAIKVFGNEGTHGSELSKNDLLEAYRVIDYVLSELYLRPLKHREMIRSSEELTSKYR